MSFTKSLNVPNDFTKPSKSYKVKAWIAFTGLILFLISYLLLTGYFVYKTLFFFNSFSNGDDNTFLTIGFFLISGFLSVFMLKALFFFRRNKSDSRIQITEKDQPELFRFINELADEIGAPRANKVFLSHEVNACVFYDLSLLNLLFSSKKNLEIGLGLVNTLNISELKAVLAHEFGHFAQKTMAIGKWVYVGNQIAVQIISKRDVLDRFLSGLSSIDIRIAWIGWAMQILIWAVRSVAETFFRIVILADRALSREMEFQADLVAVSVTGSDALIQGLYKLNAAGSSLDAAIDYAIAKYNDGEEIKDVFSLQSLDILKMRSVLGDEEYAKAPKIPENNRENNRIFNTSIAQPPTMWLTHPSNLDREENAKKVYIYAPQFENSAWDLFSDSESLKRNVTHKLLSKLEVKKKEFTLIENEIAHKEYSERFRFKFLDKKYKGLYLNRFVFKNFQNAHDVYDFEIDDSMINQLIVDSYPDKLIDDIEAIRFLEEERDNLEANKNRTIVATGGIIQHRGEQLKRKEIPLKIEAINSEIAELEKELDLFFKQSKSAYYTFSKKISTPLSNYYASLLKLLHYAEHSNRNLIDVKNYLNNTCMHVFADGKVSSGELRDLLQACNKTERVLSKIYTKSKELELNSALKSYLDGKTWSEYLGKFELGIANEENINQWLDVIDGWVGATSSMLSKLISAGLEEMLRIEDLMIKHISLGNAEFGTIPSSVILPSKYTVLLGGKERKVKSKLGAWDRFYTADGIVPTIFRLAVASLIIGATIYGSSIALSSDVYVYNGLQRTVSVDYGDGLIELKQNDFTKIKMDEGNSIIVKALNGELIQQYTPEFETGAYNYIFNVAGAASFIESSISYGGEPTVYPDNILRGSPIWSRSDADYILEEPPSSIEMRRGSKYEIRQSLSGISEYPSQMLFAAEKETEKERMIMNHLRWDESSDENLLTWYSIGSNNQQFAHILRNRLESNPRDISALRALQDYLPKGEREKEIKRQQELSEKYPEDGDLKYLAIRGMEDGPEQANLFISLYPKYTSSGWFSNGAAYAFMEKKNWGKALEAYINVVNKLPGLKSMALESIERIKRVKGLPKIDLLDDEKNSRLGYLRQFDEVPTMEFKNSPYFGYYLLQKGKLEEAMEHVKGTSEELLMVRLIGASLGASDKMIERFNSLASNEGLSQSTLITSIALKIKNGSDFKEYENQMSTFFGEKSVQLLSFLETLKTKDIELITKADEELNLPLVYLGYCRLAAKIVLENNCPENWSDFVNKALFAPERCYY
ncbi:MAG: hypothetical protein CMP61_02270 [Flavobacteriales bacterium]|nr:hypothetical protein [Flavobacteriales bacterium]|tara:strand:+ start:7406 stop:11227 length:3822 start_codon:yes stop_codon:yes gene_type:complete